MKLRSLTLLSASALVAVGAHAATSFSIPKAKTDFGDATNVPALVGTLDKANAAISNASLTINGDWLSSLTLTNNNTNTSSFKYDASTSEYFHSNLPSLDALINGVLFSYSIGTADSANALTSGPFKGGITLLAGGQESVGPKSDAPSAVIDLSSILGDLSGAGSFNISCHTLSNNNFTGGGNNIAADQQNDVGCGASISYTLVPPPPPSIPEPDALALVGIAMAALTLVRRRKSSAA